MRAIVVMFWAVIMTACQNHEALLSNEAKSSSNKSTLSQSSTFQDYGPIPGPRTCFWARGPHSADPYINLAYPDANVFYWAALFTIPDGATLTLAGDYPHARYMSFISYDERGRPIESLPDFLIAPGVNPDDPEEAHGRLGLLNHIVPSAHAQTDTLAVNPFIPGNARNSPHRRYTVRVDSQAPSTHRTVGARSGQTGNILHAPPYGSDGAVTQQLIIYRIYLPDAQTAPNGGVALPEPLLTLANGQTIRGAAMCDTLKTTQPLKISLDAVGIPPVTYRKLITQKDKPDTWPSKIPAEWFIQLDRQSLLGIYTGDINENARRSEGGFYPNLDNHYIRTIVNRKHGKVFMVRGKAPTTPKTVTGDAVMGDGNLRYWSLCSNQGFANTRVTDCLYDEEVPIDESGFYTIILSRAEDRPRNATPECGLAWLPMADDGDGLFDDDVTVLQFRHMLTADDFPHSVQRVEKQADLAITLGPYMPQTRYLMPNQVETFFPCFPSQKD